jgi:hypothetical protein
MVTKKSNNPVRRTAAKRTLKTAPEESIFVRLSRIGEAVPSEDWDRFPRDSAKNFDHYADGSPRED